MLGGGRTVARPGGLRGRLAVQSEVEPGRLGVIGSCTGGGFAAAAATRSDFAVATDARARVLAFLADRLQGPAGGEPTGGGG